MLNVIVFELCESYLVVLAEELEERSCGLTPKSAK